MFKIINISPKKCKGNMVNNSRFILLLLRDISSGSKIHIDISCKKNNDTKGIYQYHLLE